MSSETRQKSASETYQKLSQLEHVLKRPDSYIGSVEATDVPMWVCDASGDMKFRTVKIVPGLYKIFDEVLVNAADNKVRDPAMKHIKATINTEAKEIAVFNDGQGIPIEMHAKEKLWIPELIFGNLLTSSNYDDDEQKVTGGRNGFGAKLCNIFSTRFELETADKKQLYRQIWTDNMTKVNPPEIIRNPTGKSYTKVTFVPDLKRFGMDHFDEDLLSVLRRRVYDLAGTTRGVTVSLDGEPIRVSDFKAYVDMYVKAITPEGNDAAKIVYCKPSDRWEIAFAVSDGQQFNQMSFVNSIATTAGGTHVNHITDKIITYIIERMEKINKNSKAAKLTRNQIRQHLFLFVNCKITNPSFASQTKEQLTSKVSAFGSKIDIPEKFLKDLFQNTGILNRLQEITESNLSKELSKQDGKGRKKRLTGYLKLDDANKAGTRESHKCTLILTEGDSAKALAMDGLAVVGRDYYGCFPLRGKILNVRDASHDSILKNAEIQALKQIIGLQHNTRYDSVEGLRYGHIMVMTDQDHDGSHIKGLIINFLESSFPGLLDIPGFLVEFVTPIVKVQVYRGSKVQRELLFYSMPEYEAWREDEGKRCTWSQKYYKGLGSSKPLEMKQYFANLEDHEKEFLHLQEGDHDRIELAFSKSRVEDRKQWLADFVPGTHLDPDLKIIPVRDFIDKELILFSMADNIRSVPSVVDGFKPGQRKVMWVSLHTLKSSTKVQSLSGRTLERAKYHHAPESLSQTIVALAQDFVGTNNIYWLLPNGGFGSRAKGGKDSSADRYIETELNNITRMVFHKDDDALLNYLQDDEKTVEPEYYVPVLPTLLVNGSEGIGTGWSTNIPSYNPEDLVENIRRLMRDEPLKPLTPWYRGWTGEIQRIPGSTQFRVVGRIEEIDETTLAITELPVRMWTQTMKEFLIKSTIGNAKESAKDKATGQEKSSGAGEFIDEYFEEHRDGVRFVVKLSKTEMEKARQQGLYQKFRLISTISTSNMVAFDPQGRLRRYESAEDMLRDFYHVRLDFYVKRKEHLVNALRWDLERLNARARFIKMIIEGGIIVNNKRKLVLEQELRDIKFPMFVGNKGAPTFPDSIKIENEEEESEDEQEEELAANDGDEDNGDATASGGHVNKLQKPSYDYLLNMHIASLTRERYERLLREVGDTETELNRLLALGVKDIWSNDLDQFLEAYRGFLKFDEEARLAEVVPGKSRAKKGGRKRKANNDDDDDDDDFGGGGKPKPKRRATKKSAAAFADAMSTPIAPPPIEDALPKAKVVRKPRVKKEDTPGGLDTPQTESPESAVAIDDGDKTTDTAKAAPKTSKAAPKAKAPARAPKAAPKTTRKRTPVVVSDDEDEEMDLPVVREPRAPRPRRAATPASMAVDSESDISEPEDPEDSVFVMSD